MGLGLYGHPWDHDQLGPRGGLRALRDLGVDDMALAVAYHAGRWMTPTGGSALVRFLEDGVVHFRPGVDYGEFVPVTSTLVKAGKPSPLQRFLTECGESGLESHAWTVLFHNSRLAERYRGSCIRNAFGDAYTYALCPARPEVREYGLALCQDVARHPGLDVLELEAAGFMGYKHGSHHDKSSFVPDVYTDFLLSYCFCGSCAQGLGSGGVDPDAVRARVQQLLRAVLFEADAMRPQRLAWQAARDRLQQDLGDNVFATLQRHRAQVYEEFLGEVRQALPPGVRLSLHLHPDALFTGSQLGQPFSAVEDWVDEVIVTHYGQDPEQIAEMWQGQQTGRIRTRIAIWPKAPQFTSDEDLDAVMRVVSEHYLDGIRIYHLGLLPWQTIKRVFGRVARTTGLGS